MQRHVGTTGSTRRKSPELKLLVWIAGAKFTIARLRHGIERKAGFNPGQPRDAQGRWTDGNQGGGAGGIGTGIGSDDSDLGPGDIGADDLGLGDVDFGDLDFGDGEGETFRTVETDKSGEAPWSTVVSDRRSDGSLAQELVFNRDGSTIHSEYATPGDNLGWDERHTVVTSGGDRIRFERSGETQTITDANTGEVLGRSTWGESGPEPEARLQPAFVGPAAPATIEAGAALYVWLSNRNGPDSTAVLSFRADEFKPGEAPQATPEWVGTRTRDETNAACPRHEEVQSRTDDVADRVRREGNYWSATEYGTKVHTALKKDIEALGDPNFRAEASFIKSEEAGYGKKGSIRVDVLEKVDENTVCVYDIKTGRSGLSPARALEIATNVQLYYQGTTRIIVIETRPRR